MQSDNEPDLRQSIVREHSRRVAKDTIEIQTGNSDQYYRSKEDMQ